MERPSTRFLSRLVDRAAEAAIRLALGYSDGLDTVRDYPLLIEAAKAVAPKIASFDGVSYRCEVCGKGPFTRKGLYLHLKRVHMSQVKQMVSEYVQKRLAVEGRKGSGGAEHAH